MKEVYASWCTEYEFGQRDDGVYFSQDLDALKEKIKHVHSLGDRDGYWRCSEPIVVFVEPKVWRKYAAKEKKGVKVFLESSLPDGFYKKVK